MRAAIYPDVVARDAELCVSCGRVASGVHEICPRSMLGAKRKGELYSLRNMCCLCEGCHSDLHNPAGRGRLLNILRQRHRYIYAESPWSQYIDGNEV